MRASSTKGIYSRFADGSQPSALAHRLRKQRFAHFKSLLPTKRLRILDVGGTESFWASIGRDGANQLEVTLFNLEPQNITLDFLHAIQGDARDLSQFSDKQFDVVFSNSVIEHVGGIRAQQEMANEVRRVCT